MNKDSGGNEQEANVSFELQSINASSRITKVTNEIENVTGKAIYIRFAEKTHLAQCTERILNKNATFINKTIAG